MKQLLCACGLVLLGAPSVFSQPQVEIPAFAVTYLLWDQSAPDLETARGYIYRMYDTSDASVQIVTATCTGEGGIFQCETRFPAFTPGPHVIVMTTGNLSGESPMTAPFAFMFKAIPSTPVGLRIEERP